MKSTPKQEVELAITALFHEAHVFVDRAWGLHLAPPPDHQYHRPENLDEAVASLDKINVAMKVLRANLKKMEKKTA